ncbi:MAG: PKD domain-containing protein [Flavobacteriales bacterium]|nr:PKD domain-containing protein [Flavobacteriales bacterium]
MRRIFSIIVFLLFAQFSSAVVNFTSTTQSGCIPFSVQFTAQAPGAIAYQWSFGNGSYSSLQNPSCLYQNAGVYTVKLVVQYSNGSSDSIIKPNYITAHALPSGSIAFSSAQTCPETGSVAFTLSGSGYQSVLWNFGDGTNSSLVNPAHTYMSAGTFFPSVTLMGAGNCQTTISSTNSITIQPVSPANFSVNTNLICGMNNPAVFNGPSGMNNYNWNFGDNTSAVTEDPQHVYTSPGAYYPQLIVTNTFGCKDTFIAAVPVTVQANPTAQLSASAYTGCAPLSINFNCSSVPGAIQYQWNFGDGGSASGQSISHSYTQAGNYHVTCTVLMSTGCSFQFDLNNNIVIPPLPVPSFTSGPTSGCAPFSVQFNNTSQNATSYSWNFGDGGTSTQIHPNHTFLNNGNFTVVLHAYNAAGCEVNTVATNLVNAIRVVPSFTTSNNSGCGPLTVQFTNSTQGLGLNQYLWYFGDGTTSNALNPSHTYQYPGIYAVSLVAITPQGCRDSVNIPNSVNVLNPAASFPISGTVQGCAPFTTHFTDSTFNAYTWQWNFGDGTTSTQQNVTHVYQQPGQYNVSLAIMIQGGCSLLFPNYKTVKVGRIESTPLVTTDCNTGQITLTDTLAVPHTTSWAYSGNTYTGANVTNVVPPGNIYSLTMTITDSLGCVTTHVSPFGINTISCGGGGGAGVPGGNGNVTLPYFQPQLYGCGPFTVDFIYPGWNGVQFIQWNFGDGTTSNQINDQHTYSGNGVYTVSLQVNNNGMNQIIQFPDMIHVSTIQSQFSISHLPGCIDSSLVMQDFTNGAVAWNWLVNGQVFNSNNALTNLAMPAGISDLSISSLVMNAQGCVSTSSQSVYASTILTAWSNDYLVCDGQPVTLGCSMANMQLYDWDFGDGQHSSLPNPTHNYQTAGNYFPSVTVLAQNGCSYHAVIPQAIVSYVPHPEFTILPQSSCTSLTVSFNNLSTGYALPLNSFMFWNFGDGTTSHVLNPTHTYQLPGTYTVSLGVGGGGCFHYAYATVTVGDFNATLNTHQLHNCLPADVNYSVTAPGFSAAQWNFADGQTAIGSSVSHVYQNYPATFGSVIVSDYRGCTDTLSLPGITQFTAYASTQNDLGCAPLQTAFNGLAPFCTGSWNFGDGTTSNGIVLNHTYSNPGSYSAYFIATDTTGCVDTAFVNPVVVQGPQISIAADTLAGCFPLGVNFSSSTQNAVSVLWNFGNGSTSVLNNPSYLYPDNGTYSVYAVASSANGCTDTSNVLSINAIGPDAIISGPGFSTCPETNVSFQQSSNNAVTYLWNFGDGATSALANPDHIYVQSGNYNVMLQVSDSLGCTDIAVANNFVTVYNDPQPQLILIDSIGCAPLLCHFQWNAIVGNGSVIYFGDNTSQPINAQNVSHTYTQAGIYHPYLLWNSAHGCTDTVHLPSILVREIPDVSIHLQNSGNCAPVQVELSVNANVPINGFQWSLNGQNVSSSSVYSTILNPGNYIFSGVFTDQFGCRDTVVLNTAVNVGDTTAPVQVDLKRVSVLNSSMVTIEWNPASGNGLATYTLYRSSAYGNNFLPIAVIPVNGFPAYVDSSINPLNNSWCYYVVANDSCGRNSIPSDIHCTIENSAHFAGNNQVDIHWNVYSGAVVNSYRVWRKKPLATQFIPYTTVFNNKNGEYIDTQAVCSGEYVYLIEAMNLDGTSLNSWSDTAIVNVNGIDVSGMSSRIIRSTVIDDARVLTEWTTDSSYSVFVSYVELYKSINEGQTFSLVTSFPGSSGVYIDNDVMVDKKSYLYKVRAISVCESTLEESNLGSSILLQSERMDDFTIRLFWSEYKNWNTGVASYEIQKLDAFGNWVTVEVVPGNTTEIQIRE